MKKIILAVALLAAPLAFAGDIEMPKQDEGKGKGSEDCAAYICYETRGHYDFTCVNQQDGSVLRFDHESAIDENSACMKMEDKTYHCSADFLNHIED